MNHQGQKDTLIARARTAKTTTQVNDMLGSITGTTSMDAFDRMQEKVENLEANAEVRRVFVNHGQCCRGEGEETPRVSYSRTRRVSYGVGRG